MKLARILPGISLGLFALTTGFAQPLSSHAITYLVSYEATQQQYTAWVVPGYSTPNTNNTETVERGATAQFTLKVPTSFSLTGVVDVKGSWSKQPLRISPDQRLLAAGADPAYAYYVIGKSVEETNYGPFKVSEPVALFRFVGQGGASNQIQVLDRLDPIVKLADQTLSLNIGSSFYSRSGQAASSTARPMEQFSGISTVSTVLKQVEKQVVLGTQSRVEVSEEVIPLVLYPNPTADELQVKVFSQRSANPVKLELVDVQGKSLQTVRLLAQSGFNSFLLKVGQICSRDVLSAD